tara:strand:- start:1431 stop:1733 length:303 start_codon:yes stop_codon:yes gene_type:complete
VPASQGVDAEWVTLKPQIFSEIMDFYSAGASHLNPPVEPRPGKVRALTAACRPPAGEPLISEGREEEDSLAIKDDDSEVRAQPDCACVAFACVLMSTLAR